MTRTASQESFVKTMFVDRDASRILIVRLDRFVEEIVRSVLMDVTLTMTVQLNRNVHLVSVRILALVSLSVVRTLCAPRWNTLPHADAQRDSRS